MLTEPGALERRLYLVPRSCLDSLDPLQIPKTTYLTAFGVLVIMSYFVLAAIVLEVLFVYYLTELVRDSGSGSVWR